MKQHLTWQGLDNDILEHCEVEESAEGFTVHSDITGIMDKKPVIFRYRIVLDKSWYVTEFIAGNMSAENSFDIHAFQKLPGRWFDKNDKALHEFDDCIDIDIFPTPFTNSLPLKREPLTIGEQKEFNMLWVDVSQGEIRKERQRYLRLSEHQYQFTSLDTGFTEAIEFTSDLFVEYYPGLFQLKL